MSRRVRLLLAAATAAAVVIVLVVVLRGGDDPDGRTLKGDASRGFPLRGSLAGDDAVIDDAVSAWRKRIARSADRDDDEAAADSDLVAPDPDDDVKVLWIGQTGGDELAILAGGNEVVELSRGPGRSWSVNGARVDDARQSTDVPVGTGDSVLVPDSGTWRYVDAGGHELRLPPVDGLFYRGDDGFVLPDQVSASRSGGAGVYVWNVGGFTLADDAALADLHRVLTDGHPRSTWHAVNQAYSTMTSDPAVEESQSVRYAAPPLEVVWNGPVPGGVEGVTVAVGGSSGTAMALGYARETLPDGDEHADVDGATVLGMGSRNDAGAVVGVGYLVHHNLPYLVLAGIGTQTLHALIGRDEVSRPGTGAVVDVSDQYAGDRRPDTVAFGRDARGDVIAALPPA